MVLYPGALGAHGPYPAPVIAGAPPAVTAEVTAAAPSHYQLDRPAELFCHNPAPEPGKGGHGGARYKCVLCPVLCGGGGGPALLPPEGAPPLHRPAATRHHGPPPRIAVVTRPHPVASGGGSRAPPLDS